MNNFMWFSGVIEDIQDPSMLNRVRARCFGFHTDDKTLIPTKDLPWATVMMPCTSSGMSGLGASPHGLYAGSWVFGFFKDGDSHQDPVIIGTMMALQGGMPDTSKGFSDVTGNYPKSDYLNRSDVNKLATGTDTISYTPDSIINEPASPYAAVYPNNKVIESPAGHIIEMDDTPSAERIRIKHKSGTLVEIHPNGDMVTRNGNKWSVTTGNDKVHITGAMQVNIDSDANITVGGSTILTCASTTITGNLSVGGSIIAGTSITAGTAISAGSTISAVGGITGATIDSSNVSLDTHSHE